MKLVTFKLDDNEGIGSLELDAIIPFNEEPSLPTNMLSFLEAGDTAIRKAENLCKKPKSKISLSEVKLLAPISRPPKIIAIGLNYADHLEEVRAAGREIDTPVVPMILNKQSLSVAGPYDYGMFVKQFEKVYYSYEIGKRKPSPDIFKMVLEDNDLEAEETFYVDDGKKNTSTAKKLGIHTWHFDPLEDSIHDLDKVLSAHHS